MHPFIFAIFFTGLVCNAAMAEQCNGPRQLPIHGKMLRGHIYEELFARSGDAECLFICRKEVLCQSFNFVKTKSICEFNNRTKEAASPENFIDDKERYYVKLDVSRVPLGSIPALPAKSCKEIKANEEGKVSNGSYWFYTLIPGKSVKAPCDMDNEDIDECRASPAVCHVNATCVNNIGSPDKCTCKTGFSGNGKNCFDIDECAGNAHNCSTNANCANTVGSYTCTCHTNYHGNGKKCLFKRGLSQSDILRKYSSSYTDYLISFLNPVLQDSIRSRFRRCWHAPSQDWSSSTFHSLCDAKGPTVTIIRVNNFIFGGYTDKSWDSSSGYISSTKAFVYSLKNPYGYDNQKFAIKSSYYSYAIYVHPSYGPTFGNGHEIYTSGNNGYTSCGYAYQLPPGSSKGRCPFYTGSSSFTISEIEVFYEESD
ncbi:uncharacterized protein [Montipora foliosa]|uniref:uncharacterized protein isoform X1 n=1 Tax=Montipora foliosa TaxID=591990 RepID=UPI0035F14D91